MDLGSPPDLAFALRNSLVDALRAEVPDLVFFFPFRQAFSFHEVRRNGTIVLRLADDDSGGVPQIGQFEGFPGLRDIADGVLDGTVDRSVLTQGDWWGPRVFSYVGPAPERESAHWPELWAALVRWVNEVAGPDVIALNRTRIARAIPAPPQWDPGLIASVVVVDDGARQGSGFVLEGIGVVTCSHVLSAGSYLYLPTAPSVRYPVRVVRQNAVVDLAILEAPPVEIPALIRGADEDLPMMSQVAVLGYPNYQPGDTGVLMPGLIVGQRTSHAIRRYLTNARIVGGMSGGPAVGEGRTAVGICVTGSDRLDTTETTEEHGVLPIGALDLLVDVV